MKKKCLIQTLILLLITTFVSGCAGKQETFSEAAPDAIKKGSLPAMASVHDPSLEKGEDGTYYLFGTHMSSAKSTDLRKWVSFSDGVDRKNPLFSNLFDEELRAFSFVGKNEENWYSVWAPDVIYNKAMGKYVMYFCTSSSYICSSLCMATSDTIEGPYEFQDAFLHSGFIISSVSKTNLLDYVAKEDIKTYAKSGLGYDNQHWPNCIDPTTFYAKDGKMWMVYGSWSGGIFLLEIDETTGYPIHPEADEANQVDPYYGKRLLGGYHQSVEGPFIMYDEASDYYYLFVSYGSLNRDGGYQIRVFRSKEVDGTYVDTTESPMTLVDATNPQYNADYGLKMMGNYMLPSLETAYMAPGGNSAFTDDDGKMYIAYHQRFHDGSEYHQPRVHQMFINQSGWPVAAPFETDQESLKVDGYQTTKELAGTYYVLNHGTDISSTIQEAVPLKFYSNGTIAEVSGDQELEKGTWSVAKGTSFVTITLHEDGTENTYDGVVIEMTDEADNETICFTAAGTNNETIWAVHYK